MRKVNAMYKGHYDDVERIPQTKYGTTGTDMRVLIDKSKGAPVFAMRLISIQADGHIGMHDHLWEHEIFVLRGAGLAKCGDESAEMNPGDFLLIPPDVPHGFDNTGDDVLEFICCIPIMNH